MHNTHYLRRLTIGRTTLGVTLLPPADQLHHNIIVAVNVASAAAAVAMAAAAAVVVAVAAASETAASVAAASVAARRQLRRAWRGHVRRNQPTRAVRSVCRCLMTLKEPRVHVRTISCLSTQLEVLGRLGGSI